MTQHFILHKGDDNRATVLKNAHAFLDRLPDSQSWEIEVKRHVKARTDKQRKALFAVAYKAMMEFSGLQGADDKEELHRFWCGEYFGWTVDAFGRKRPERTTMKDHAGRQDEISVDEALKFYHFLQQRAAEVGCFIADPDPFWREHARAKA